MTRLALAAALAVAAAACSSDVGPTPGRTVEVRMKDVAFVPATLSVARGETVTFRFTNEDTVAHDAFVGDAAAQAGHEQEMRSGGGHGGHGAAAVKVPAGQQRSLTHTFDTVGTIEIGCHEPGHYAAGMKLTITVT